MHRLSCSHPKIGTIVLSSTELLQRAKSKAAVCAYSENLIVLTKGNKAVMPRMTMQVLGGDTYFNKWNVPVIPHHQLVKCTLQECKRIFKDDEEAQWYDQPDAGTDDADATTTSTEIQTADTKYPPFPQEHHMNLGLEMINVFTGEIMILMKPGVGEMLKAVLIKLSWAIAICKDNTQKQLIITNLKDFA